MFSLPPKRRARDKADTADLLTVLNRRRNASANRKGGAAGLGSPWQSRE